MTIINLASGQVAIRLGARGPNSAPSPHAPPAIIVSVMRFDSSNEAMPT